MKFHIGTRFTDYEETIFLSLTPAIYCVYGTSIIKYQLSKGIIITFQFLNFAIDIGLYKKIILPGIK